MPPSTQRLKSAVRVFKWTDAIAPSGARAYRHDCVPGARLVQSLADVESLTRRQRPGARRNQDDGALHGTCLVVLC
jgi:hypothetical protein